MARKLSPTRPSSSAIASASRSRATPGLGIVAPGAADAERADRVALRRRGPPARRRGRRRSPRGTRRSASRNIPSNIRTWASEARIKARSRGRLGRDELERSTMGDERAVGGRRRPGGSGRADRGGAPRRLGRSARRAGRSPTPRRRPPGSGDRRRTRRRRPGRRAGRAHWRRRGRRGGSIRSSSSSASSRWASASPGRVDGLGDGGRLDCRRPGLAAARGRGGGGGPATPGRFDSPAASAEWWRRRWPGRRSASTARAISSWRNPTRRRPAGPRRRSG